MGTAFFGAYDSRSAPFFQGFDVIESGAVEAYNPRARILNRKSRVMTKSEDVRALSLADCISRIPSNRTRVVVPLFKLFGESIPRHFIASTRVFVLTSHNVGIRMDGEYTTAYRRN
jgi:hypothetical protein